MTWLYPKRLIGMFAKPLPLESKDSLPVCLHHIFDELHLIQDQVSPPPPQKMALVFHQQLVGCQTYMEAIGFPPPLWMTHHNVIDQKVYCGEKH